VYWRPTAELQIIIQLVYQQVPLFFSFFFFSNFVYAAEVAIIHKEKYLTKSGYKQKKIESKSSCLQNISYIQV